MSSSEIIDLESERELRILVCEPKDKIIIRMIQGSAEIFGSELHINQYYEFSYFSSVTVFTWHGCTMKIRREGSKYSKYAINSFKQIPKMRDLHEYLEQFRINADVNNADYPVTLIVGPTDVGKSTLCRFLVNYAAKHGRRPIFVDLDVGQNSLSIAGTFGVLSVDEPSDIHGRFKQQATSVYYFGYKSPGHNMALYKLLLKKLQRTLIKRLNKEGRSSGVVINTCGWVEGPGYNLTTDIIKILDVNVVLALSDTLYYKLKNDVLCKTRVVHVPEIKGAVTRNRTVRLNNRNTSVNEYFYGSSRQLQPHTITVNFNDLQIFKAENKSHDSSYEAENTNIISVSIEPSILYQVFGLSYAEHVEDIPFTSVYGFISIVELDIKLKVASVLSPHPGPLPTKYLLMGDIMLTQK